MHKPFRVRLVNRPVVYHLSKEICESSEVKGVCPESAP